MRLRLACFVAVIAAVCLGQTAATIDIDTTNVTPIHPRFSGVNDEVTYPVEYWDYRFNALANQVGYGWVRFPGGNSSDPYSWILGEDIPEWLAPFASGSTGPGPNSVANVAGKGGGRLIDAANRANLLGASLIICANGFSDSPQSIGALAAYVKANQIQVAAWELSNEPYLYPAFFPTATAYLDKMKPYRDAIKAVDPNAIVAVFVRDPGAGGTQNPWDSAVAAYPDKYWDAITFHHYPAQSTGTFSQWMADEAAVLLTKTTALVTNQLTPIGPPGVKFLITEFDPSLPNDNSTGANSITDGTLWGGIYVVEYLMRMSTLPSILYAGPHALVSASGVLAANDHYGDVDRAANHGTSIDTSLLDFGFYLAAQANGLAILNSVINRSIQSNKTTVTGGVNVPATGITGGVPALYAMTYTNVSGGLSVVITNKSATPHQVTFRVNGSATAGAFPTQFITASDPSAANTATNPNVVPIQGGNSANPVIVPAYCVMRVDLTTPAVATFVNAASQQTGPVAPQQLVTASGAGFASQSIAAPNPMSLPLMLGDTSITITDSKGIASPAPLASVSSSGAEFQVPASVARGSATVKVIRSGTVVLTGTLNVGSVSPGLYSANGNGAGVAAASAIGVDGVTVRSAAVFSCQSGIPLSCLSSPLFFEPSEFGLFVFLDGTGIRGAGTVQAFVAGQQVPVLYAGAQAGFAGVDDVIIFVPRNFAGAGESSVYIIADGKPSNMTTVKFQ